MKKFTKPEWHELGFKLKEAFQQKPEMLTFDTASTLCHILADIVGVNEIAQSAKRILKQTTKDGDPMKVHCDGKVLETRCTGCPCHWDDAIVMGEMIEECCGECGCPKTKAAFNRLYKEFFKTSDETPVQDTH